MPINVPLLRKELEFLTAHPEQHKQSWWLEWRDAVLNETIECGTKGCLAGNALLHAGRLRGHTHVYWTGSGYESDGTNYWPDGEDYASYAEHSALSWTRAGAALFGLTYTQADKVFYQNNTLPDLWRLANKFTNGEIEIPPEVSDNTG